MMSSRLRLMNSMLAGARNYSAQPAVNAAPASAPSVTKLDNGWTVVCMDSPTSTSPPYMGIMVKAGSRYQNYYQAGYANILSKMAFGMGSKDFTGVCIVRNVQHAGTTINCESGRETLFFNAPILSEQVSEVIDFLFNVSANNGLKRWEFLDNLDWLKKAGEPVDLNSKSEDLLHKAAYRDSGLGSYQYAPDDLQLLSYDKKYTQFRKFYEDLFTSDRMSLVGVGIDESKLIAYAKGIDMSRGKGPDAASKFVGGEIRCEAPSNNAYVHIAAEVGGRTNTKDYLTARLLRNIIGDGPHIVYGNSSAKIAKSLADPDIQVKGVNFGYSDSGLLGVSIKAKSDLAKKAVETAAAGLRNLSISEAELKASKNILLVNGYEVFSTASTLANRLAYQSLFVEKDQLIHPGNLRELLDSISLGDVQAMAKKVSGGKWAMSATGNLSNVPYLDSL